MITKVSPKMITKIRGCLYCLCVCVHVCVCLCVFVLLQSCDSFFTAAIFEFPAEIRMVPERVPVEITGGSGGLAIALHSGKE